MIKTEDIISKIEKYASLDLMEPWDNSGWQINLCHDYTNKVLVALSLTKESLEQETTNDCDLIITHHPLIFDRLNAIDDSVIIEAIRHNISVYSAHTNVDFCDGGLNDYVAEQIGLKNIEKINGNDSPRIGFLPSSLSLNEYAGELKKIFNDNNITTIGDINKKISKVAIVNGGGGSDEKDLLTAVEAGADVFITGDIKYHVARLAKDLNYAIIQVGHYNSEQGFMPLIEKIIGDVIDKKIIHKASKLLNPYN